MTYYCRWCGQAVLTSSHLCPPAAREMGFLENHLETKENTKSQRTTKEYGDIKVVSFKDDQETRDKVFQYLLDNYFFVHGSFFGECIMQSDDPIIFAPEVMSHIADNIIEFDVVYKENEDE